MKLFPMPQLQNLTPTDLRLLLAQDCCTTKGGQPTLPGAIEFRFDYCASPGTPLRTKPKILVTLHPASGQYGAALDLHFPGLNHTGPEPICSEPLARSLVEALLGELKLLSTAAVVGMDGAAQAASLTPA